MYKYELIEPALDCSLDNQRQGSRQTVKTIRCAGPRGLTETTLAVVMAGGNGSRLGALTRWHAKPALPFGGQYRNIDFTLSNCVNSGVKRIAVLTQYKAHSLIQHLQQGWSFLSAETHVTKIGAVICGFLARNVGRRGT